MQTLLVTFDELLHVHRNAATQSMPKHTVFSFISNFQYTPYVSVPGFPRLEPGMQVAVMLREENNWQTLMGWRDMNTGDLVAPDPSWHRWRLVFICGWAVLAIFCLLDGITDLGPQSFLIMFVVVIWTVFSALEFRAWKQAQVDVKTLSTIPFA